MPDVTAICRAYVDLVVKVSDADLSALGLSKGDDVPADTEHMEKLLSDLLPRGKLLPGGPAANSMAGVAALGGKAAFIGKVADDETGKTFIRDFTRRGVHFDCGTAGASGTACCIVLVTPDGQRSMIYNPGIADAVTSDDIESNRDILRQTRILYLGLLDRIPECAEIVGRVRKYALGAKTVASLQSYQRGTASLASHVLKSDIILGNEDEFPGFVADIGFGTLAEAAKSSPGKIFACTLGAEGARIYSGGYEIYVPAVPVSAITDTTGAGDAWAAGFLYGLSREMSLEKSASLAAACAAQMLNEDGGRPTKSWTSLVEEEK